ncbi:MAG: hypothetical protein ACLQKY_14160 [Terracidiphilus sp.]
MRAAGSHDSTTAHGFDGQQDSANPHRGMNASAEDVGSEQRFRIGGGVEDELAIQPGLRRAWADPSY